MLLHGSLLHFNVSLHYQVSGRRYQIMGSTCKSSFDLIMALLSEFVLSHNDLGADFQSRTLDLWMFGAKGREPWYLPRFSQPAPSLISALLVGSLFDIFIRWQIVSHALPFLVDQAEEDRGQNTSRPPRFWWRLLSRLEIKSPAESHVWMWNTLTYDEIIFLLYEICLPICPPLLGNLKSTSPFSPRWVFRETGELQQVNNSS